MTTANRDRYRAASSTKRTGTSPPSTCSAPVKSTPTGSSSTSWKPARAKETTQIGLQARHFDQEFIWKLAANPRVLDWMEGVMGEDLLLLSTHFFCKYPDAKGEKFVAWHQDVTYWGLEPDEAPHRLDRHRRQRRRERLHAGDSRLPYPGDRPARQVGPRRQPAQHQPGDSRRVRRQDQRVNLELKAGQMSIHYGKVYHASHPNTSKRRRCGLTVRFIPPEARQTEITRWAGTGSRS